MNILYRKILLTWELMTTQITGVAPSGEANQQVSAAGICAPPFCAIVPQFYSLELPLLSDITSSVPSE